MGSLAAMRGSLRTAAWLALAVAGWGGRVVAVRAAEGTPNVVQYHDDRLTVRASQVTLEDLLAAIGAQAGAEIRGRPKDAKAVSVEFESVPMAEAMHRLLGEQNFTLVYGDGGRLKAIRLHGGPQGPPITTAAPAAATETPEARKGGLFQVMAALDQHPPVPISGRLSEAMNGATEASFRQLFESASDADDPAIRIEATRAFLNALELDPQLRQGVVTGMSGISDGVLAKLLHAATSDRAQEMLTHVAAFARTSEIRVKAASVLQVLNNPKPGPE